MSDWCVYILECVDGSYYTGITTDIERRLTEHNHSTKAAKYTRVRRPVKLVYREECADRSDASIKEYKIRKLNREKKQALITAYENMLDC